MEKDGKLVIYREVIMVGESPQSPKPHQTIKFRVT